MNKNLTYHPNPFYIDFHGYSAIHPWRDPKDVREDNIKSSLLKVEESYF